MALVTVTAMHLVLGTVLPASTPWPQPSHITTGSATLRIDGAVRVTVVGSGSAGLPPDAPVHVAAMRVGAALGRGNGRGCAQRASTDTPTLRDCSVTVASPGVPLGPEVDESYTLELSAAGYCAIGAGTQWGAIHALESLSQLANENCTIENAPVAIDDRPRFSFRSLMIDSSRHFLPVPFLKHIIDAMAANKLNILHWHIVDSQAFPYNSTRFPKLVEGAYSTQATYQPSQISELVTYAASRAVRVMPEFDIPGHGDWSKGNPAVMVLDGPCTNTLNPTIDATYTFLEQFLLELGTIFPEQYLFLGGDEVSGDCWSGSPTVQSWMTRHGMNATQLGRYFWQQMTSRVLPKLNKVRDFCASRLLPWSARAALAGLLVYSIDGTRRILTHRNLSCSGRVDDRGMGGQQATATS